MELWKGKVAVVTGASAGIGAAICKDLCKHNVIVVGLARRLDRLQQLQEDISNRDPTSRFHPIKCDLTSEEDIQEAFFQILSTFGGVDILINNAGVFELTSFLDEENLDRLKKVIDTNFLANVSCTKKAYKSMSDRDVPGYIINISSVMGHSVPSVPGVKPQSNVYGPTKYALTALNDVIRHELNYKKQKKIRVSNVSPGAVRTEIFEAAGLSLDTQEFGELSFLEPEDVSAVVINLLSSNPRVQIQDVIMRHVGEL